MRIDGNQELCGGALELHLLACPVMPVKSNKQQKHSFVTKVVVPLLASIVSLVVVVSVVVFWRGKQKANIPSSRPHSIANSPKFLTLILPEQQRDSQNPI